MILVADSGSTKTDWRLVDSDGNTKAFQTKGLNPIFTSEEEILKELENAELASSYSDKITAVHFYGAGVTNELIINKITTLFSTFFPNATVNINDDLMAAARALYRNGSGIVCILGTGSNSCLYENGEIMDKVPALGYILGDEGSGANIGKRFINALFKRQLPEKLTIEICKKNNITIEGIIERVYKNSFPNRYLASLTRIVNENIQHESIVKIVEEAFIDLVNKNISHYNSAEEKSVGFVGSIAYHFQAVLTHVLKSKGLAVSEIIQSPIDELTNFHKENINE